MKLPPLPEMLKVWSDDCDVDLDKVLIAYAEEARKPLIELLRDANKMLFHRILDHSEGRKCAACLLEERIRSALDSD